MEKRNVFNKSTKNPIENTWSNLSISMAHARSSNAWSTSEIKDLPTYIPGIPFGTETYSIDDLDSNQGATALAIYNQCVNNFPKNSPLPSLNSSPQEINDKKILFALLPNYLATNAIIILKSAHDAVAKTQEASGATAEILDLAKTIKFLCKILRQKGDLLIKLLDQAQALQQEIEQTDIPDRETKEKQLKALQQETLHHHGQLDKNVIIGSYFGLLHELKPYIKKITEFQAQYHTETQQLNASLIEEIKASKISENTNTQIHETLS